VDELPQYLLLYFRNKKKFVHSGVVFLVAGEKFNLGEKVQICLVGFFVNSVGTPLEFAAFRGSFDAKHSRASAFWFFLSTTMGFTADRTHFARKNTSIFMLIGSLSRRKK